MQRRASAAYIRNYEDPARRSVMLEDRKAMVRRFTRGLADVAGLSDEEMDRLVDLVAEQGLERTLWDHRCRVDPSCDEAKHTFPNAEQHAAAIEALLGPDKYQSYRQFRLAGPERGIVEQLRLRLVDRDPLGNKAAQQLIAALWEERERYFAQAAQRGVGLGLSWTSDSIVVTHTVGQGPGSTVDHHALEFNELTRARAAAILSPEQLRVFSEMQDEAYRTLGSILRKPAAAKAQAGPAR